MAVSGFETAVDFVLRLEGGYADHPADPGGATNRGITRATLAAHRGRPVSRADVRSLSRAEAIDIYRDAFWRSIRGDDLPAGLDLALFDFAVNSGPARAVRALQRLLGVRPDGIVGPVTLGAIRARDPAELVALLTRDRLAYLRRLPTWPTFGRGWSRRVADVEREALAIAGVGEVDIAAPQPEPPAPADAPRPSWVRRGLDGVQRVFRAIFLRSDA